MNTSLNTYSLIGSWPQSICYDWILTKARFSPPPHHHLPPILPLSKGLLVHVKQVWSSAAIKGRNVCPAQPLFTSPSTISTAVTGKKHTHKPVEGDRWGEEKIKTVTVMKTNDEAAML